MKISLKEFIYSEEPLEGTIDASSGPSRLPEQRLWQAFLVQMLIDATQGLDNQDKRNAIAFFEASIGGVDDMGIPTTATWRNDTCYLAGFEPSFIIKIYQKLRNSHVPLGKYGLESILERLE